MSGELDKGLEVLTPDGPGRIIGSRGENVWPLGQKPRRVVFVTVELNKGGRRDYRLEQIDLERAE